MTLQPHKKRGRIVGEEPVRRRNFFDLSFGDHRSYCALLACQFPVEANRHHCCLNHLQIASQLSESSLSYHLRNGFFDNKQRDSCCTSLVLLKNRKIETGVPTLDNNSDIFREYPWLQTETFSLPNPRPEKFCWIFFKKKPDLYHSLDSETKLSWRLTPHKDLICENETIVNASLNLRYPTEQAKALKDLQEGNWTFNHYQLNSVSLYCLSFLKKKLGEEKRIAGDRDGIEVKESSPQNQTGSSSTSQKKTTTSGGTGSSIIPVHGGGKQYDTNASHFPLLKAPSVVFIDELDAVGRERGLTKGSGGQERDATLNQLLVSLDGFEGRGEAITIASTNRPDILDPALVRPGRFDRKIFIPKPGLIGTMEILQVRARKKLMAEDLDYMAVASMTDGIVGAELANIVEIAAINMMRDGRTELTTDDLLQAAQIEERGMLDRKDRSSETWRQVAINEAAIAVVAVNFPDLKNIEFGKQYDTKASHFPLLKGDGAATQGEISFASWNRKVQPILASTSYNGTTVIWNLRKKKPLVNFEDSVPRRCSVLQWNPDIATQIKVASDSSPTLKFWDMRNIMQPVCEFPRHQKGVIAMEWCPRDSSYLLTCAKDNRPICWDTNTAEVHARKKLMAEDLDYMAVASMTDGMVGAELANIVEIAAINMMRDGRTELTTDDLLQAAQIEERGMVDRKDRSSETWRQQVAINEAAIAVVSVNFPDLKNIEFLTINPRAGRELGYVRVKMDHIKFKEGMLSRQSLLDHITVQLAPRAADELWYGENQLSTIWAETSDNARSAARSLVHGGLSEKHHGLDNFWDIDLEALRILNMCYERAKEILQKNRTLMDEVVEKLVQKKSLSKQEFFTLVELYGSIKPMPPRLLELTKIKRLQL